MSAADGNGMAEKSRRSDDRRRDRAACEEADGHEGDVGTQAHVVGVHDREEDDEGAKRHRCHDPVVLPTGLAQKQVCQDRSDDEKRDVEEQEFTRGREHYEASRPLRLECVALSMMPELF